MVTLILIHEHLVNHSDCTRSLLPRAGLLYLRWLLLAQSTGPEHVGFSSGGSRAEHVGPSWIRDGTAPPAQAGGLLTTDCQGSWSRRTVLLTEQAHLRSWSSRRAALCSGQSPAAAALMALAWPREALTSGSSSSSASCRECVRRRKGFCPPCAHQHRCPEGLSLW